MQSLIQTGMTTQSAAEEQRKAVHDLRNLFATIGAAKSLLARDPNAVRRTDLLAAIGEATRQGGRLATDLLANIPNRCGASTIDMADSLIKLGPMLRAITNVEVTFAHALPDERLLVRAVQADFDAVIVELASNAAAAGADVVKIRIHKCGGTVWILASDNGCGMSEAMLDHARRAEDRGMAHGTGLARIRGFITACEAHLYVRSQAGAGTNIALVFPCAPSGFDKVIPSWRSQASGQRF
jgi:signal transduction histidine kinase